jgi:hypothetical protein
MADTARATFTRLGAKPFVGYLDAALASSANQASNHRRTPHDAPSPTRTSR